MTAAIDMLGWAGGIMVIAAYGLITMDRLSARSRLYHGLNALGSILLVANTAFYGAYPSTFVNVIWLGIAGLGFVRLMRARQRVA